MHEHLKEQIEAMGYSAKNVEPDPVIEQDFLIKARLMRITRTSEFTDEELAFYQAAADEERYVIGGRICTPEFSPEELHEYQWAAEHPLGSCRGFRLTEDPTGQEVKEWQESLDYLNSLNIDAIRDRVKFEREDESPVECDDLNLWPDVKKQPKCSYAHSYAQTGAKGRLPRAILEKIHSA